MTTELAPERRRREIVIGGGFGGDAAARALARASVEVPLDGATTSSSSRCSTKWRLAR